MIQLPPPPLKLTLTDNFLIVRKNENFILINIHENLYKKLYDVVQKNIKKRIQKSKMLS